MTVTLLRMAEHLSLEFETSDLEAVRDHIRARYPDVQTAPAGIATMIRFGSEQFTFQNEWDDPCLISHSAKGDELLSKVYADFGGA